MAFDIFGGKNVTIYKGPVHTVCADNFVLNKNGKIGFSKVHLSDRVGYFYIGDGKGGDFINIEEGRVLPDRNTAFVLCNNEVIKNSPSLMSILAGRVTDPKEISRIKKEIKEKTEILYYDKNEVKQYSSEPKKQFQKILKQAEERRNELKTKNKK